MLDGAEMADVHRYWVLGEHHISVYQLEPGSLQRDGQFSPGIWVPVVKREHHAASLSFDDPAAFAENICNYCHEWGIFAGGLRCDCTA